MRLIRIMRRMFAVAVLSSAICPTDAPAAEHELLSTFDGSVQDWVGQGVQVVAVSAPSVDARGALEAEVRLSGRGWTDVIIESPELNRDLGGFGEVRAHVFAPKGAPPDLKGQLFVKSGPTWKWIDAGWQPLSREQWTRLRLPIDKIDDCAQVRTVGVTIGGNSPFNGSVFIDVVEVAGGAAIQPPKVAVTISDITENVRIVGKVTGVAADKLGDYKVLVYVKTDKWYIHPYERGGDGLSFANINRDGSWRIETVKRRFAADLVAALVVRRDYSPRPTVENLTEIDSVASYTEEGRGRL